MTTQAQDPTAPASADAPTEVAAVETTPVPADGGDTVTLDSDGTVTVTLGSETADITSGYAAAFDGIVKVLIALIGAGGITAIVYIFKNDPRKAKALVNTGLTLAELLATLTPTTADDAGLAKLREEFNKAIDAEIAKRLPAVVAAAVKTVIEEEKAELRAQANAKATNGGTRYPEDMDPAAVRAAVIAEAQRIPAPGNAVDG